MGKVIHSTCGQPMVFTETANRGPLKTPEAARIIREIRIGGGAYVLDSHNNRIPTCVTTPVTDEEYEFLMNNESFKNMVKRGFMTIHDTERVELDSRGVPLDHEKKDGTAQISDEDHAKGTDLRCDHASTRASFGEQNQFGGLQPLSTETNAYGSIAVA